MLVLKSTHNQMIAEAKASARALNEMIGELIDGMKKLGFDPAPRYPGDTTAKRVIAALRSEMFAVEQFRDELAAARSALISANVENARLRADKRTGNGNLIPGGPKAKAKREAAAATH